MCTCPPHAGRAKLGNKIGPLQGFFESPLTDSNRRPLLTMEVGSVTRVHARSFAITFVLQIGNSARDNNDRALPDVLRLAYPSRTRISLSVLRIEHG